MAKIIDFQTRTATDETVASFFETYKLTRKDRGYMARMLGWGYDTATTMRRLYEHLQAGR